MAFAAWRQKSGSVGARADRRRPYTGFVARCSALDAFVRRPGAARAPRWAVLVLAAAATACTGAQERSTQPAASGPAAPTATPGRIAPAPARAGGDGAATLARIERLIGNAACRADSDCATLAIGAKPCGGPERYLVWSRAATDGRELAELASAFSQARRTAHERSGMLSDCAMVPEPAVRCVRADGEATGRCRGEPGGLNRPLQVR